MKKKRLTILIIGAVLLSAIILALFGNPFILKKRYDFGQSVKSIDAESITLNELAPFEWDAVYTFAPYMPKQEMEKILGFKSNHIRETVSEGMVQLIFVKGNRVVCDIQGYSDNLGYSVFFSIREGSYSQINYEDSAVFSVERTDNLIVLTCMQE